MSLNIKRLQEKIDYNSSSGSTGGGAYSETLLFDNTEKLSTGTLQLSDSILNYKQIVVEVTNNDSTNWNVTSSTTFLVSDLSEKIGGQSEQKGLFLTAVASAWKAVYITTENSITLGEGSAFIRRIYGIKY